MEKVKVGRPLIELVKLCYRANRSVLFSGRHGVGKSELLKQSAREMGISFICRDLSLMEPLDLIGLPKAEGQRTIYLRPEFLPEDGRGLLVFEELNRCERYMRAPCLQLLTARTLNDYCLPTGWVPFAAINPSDGEYETNNLDAALLSRFVQVHVVPDRDEWLEWARNAGIHASVIGYVESDPSVFDAAESNPRAWTYISDLLKAAEDQQAPPQAFRSAVLGVIGNKRGAAFLRSLRQPERPLTADEIVRSYDKLRQKVQRWIGEGRLDPVATSLRALLTALQPEVEYEAAKRSKAKCRNIGQFLADLPGDLQQSAKDFFAGRKYEFPITNGAKRRKRKCQRA